MAPHPCLGPLGAIVKKRPARHRMPSERIPYLSHSLSLFLVRTTYAGLSFLTLFMLGLVWGPAEQGYFALFLSAALIGGVIFGLGMPDAILYYVARGETRSWVARETAWTLGFLWLTTVGAALLVLCSANPEWMPPLIETVLGYPSYTLLGLLLAACAALTVWDGQMAVRMAMGEMGKYNAYLLTRSVCSFFLVCIVLASLPEPSRGDPGVRIWIVAAWVGVLGTVTLLATVEGRVGHPVSFMKTFAFLGKALPYGCAAAAASLNIRLLARLDHFMLLVILGDLRQVGIYALTTQAVEIPRLFSGTVASLLVPQTAADHHAGRESQTPIVVRVVALVIVGVLPLLAGAFWFAIGILDMWGEDYSAAWPVFWILCAGTFCLGLDDIFSSHLLGLKRPQWNTLISAAMLVLNVLLNLWWIPRRGIVGAAWATTVAYALGTLLTGALVLWESRISPWQLLPRPYDLVRMLDLFSSRPDTRSKT